MRKTADNSIWEQYIIKNKYPKLDTNIKTDVLIIGGGVTGALTSYIFTEQNIDTVLIERNIIANESTKASTSLLHYEIDTDLKRLMMLIDKEDAIEAFRFTLETVYKLDEITDKLENKCEYVRRPSFYFTNKEEEYDYVFSEYQVRKENNFDVEFLDCETNNDKYSFPFYAGILSYNSGAEINPVKLTNELLKYCEKKQTKIYENTEAYEFIIDDGNVEVKTKEGFSIKCKKIIISSGYDSLLFFDKHFYSMTRTFALATKPVDNFDGWNNRSLIKNTEDPYLYLRTTYDNRIIIGGEDVDVTYNEIEKYEMEDNDNLANYKYGLLEKKLNDMFPLIKNKEIEYKFNGLFIDSNDGLPYIGEHEEYPNIFFNIGIGSNGLLYGLMGAMLLLNKYLGIEDNRLKMFRFDR